MATVPLSGTNVRLLSGIPFSNDYKHTRWFDVLSQQTTYFLNQNVVHSMEQCNFQRIEGRHFISVNASIDDLWSTNYLMFQNAQYNNKWFYAFVTKLEYVQKHTTYVHFEIDVFQSWKFDMIFKPSYVVREHCKLWNADGTPVTNTIDEGLDYGSEYDFVGVQQLMPTNGIMFLVIVAKSTLHVPDGLPSANYIVANVNGTAQPLSLYIHPFDGFGETPLVNIGPHLLKQLPSLKQVLNSIYSQESAVNNIVSMYITEHCGIDWTYSGGALTPNLTLFQELEIVNVASSGTLETIYVKNLYAYSETTVTARKKYLDFGGILDDGVWSFPNIDESKLLMYPYSLTILDDFKGNRIVLKTEYIQGNDILIDVKGSMGMSNKISVIPKNYLTQNIVGSIQRDMVAIETALIDSTPHDVAIINDMLAAFLQGNRNSLMNQAATITFNGIMDAVGSSVSVASSAATRNPAGLASTATNFVRGAGNTVLQLQGLNAKLKDINNVPPSMVKQGSNTAFEYGNGYLGFWIITKQIKPEYRKKLSDFFKMYGYKVNELKMPNFHTRQNWNYVQTTACNITGNFNNDDLQDLKSVFDNGITLWHTDDVGNYALSNGVIS